MFGATDVQIHLVPVITCFSIAKSVGIVWIHVA